MKKLLLIAIIFASATASMAQKFPTRQTNGSVSTIVTQIGAGAFSKGIVIGTFADTIAMNSQSFIKNEPYIIVSTTDGFLWQRDGLAQRWRLIGGGGVSGNDSAYIDLFPLPDSTGYWFERPDGRADTIRFVFVGDGGGVGGADSVIFSTNYRRDTAIRNVRDALAGKWGKLGDIGTSSTNFIGTIDDVPLRFRINNVVSGDLSRSTFNTGFGYSTNTGGSNNALYGYSVIPVAVNPTQNSLFGRGIGNLSTTMSLTTAMGYAVLNQAQGSYQNTIMGWGAFSRANNAVANVAVGHGISNFSASNGADTMIGNTWIGHFTAERQFGGRYNLFAGYGAGRFSTTGSRNVFLGPFTGENENGSDKLYIDNTGTATPLIKGDFAANTVDVNGTLKVTGGNPGLNKVFTDIDGTGLGGWVTSSGGSADSSIFSTNYRRDTAIQNVRNALAGKWGKNGDAGTNPATDFIGTTDNVNFILRRNNAAQIALIGAGGSVAIGGLTSIPNMTGTGNVFLGHTATSFFLPRVTTGSRNFATQLGGLSNTTGLDNIFMGLYSGTHTSFTTPVTNTGNDNVFIGRQSGFSTRTGGSFNVVIGTEAGTAMDGSPTGNIFIGRHAATLNGVLAGGYSGFNSGSRNIVIGDSIQIGASNSQSNSLNIGNLIFGQNLDGFNHTISTGNIGIGVMAPSQKLQIAGNVLATQYRISALNTAPASATDTGTLGEVRITDTYIYVCTATNTWVRTALTTW